MFGQLQDVVLLDLDSQLWGGPAYAWDGPPKDAEAALRQLAEGRYLDNENESLSGIGKVCRPEIASQLLQHLRGTLKPSPASMGGWTDDVQGDGKGRKPEPDKASAWDPSDRDTPEYLASMPSDL